MYVRHVMQTVNCIQRCFHAYLMACQGYFTSTVARAKEPGNNKQQNGPKMGTYIICHTLALLCGVVDHAFRKAGLQCLKKGSPEASHHSMKYPLSPLTMTILS
jgi:hypothetical protein